MDENKKKTFKCPHCGTVVTMTEFEITGFDALMSLMPGPRLLHPQGTVPCKSCDKNIVIQDILFGKYDVTSPAQVILAVVVLAAIVAAVVYFAFLK